MIDSILFVIILIAAIVFLLTDHSTIKRCKHSYSWRHGGTEVCDKCGNVRHRW